MIYSSVTLYIAARKSRIVPVFLGIIASETPMSIPILFFGWIVFVTIPNTVVLLVCIERLRVVDAPSFKQLLAAMIVYIQPLFDKLNVRLPSFMINQVQIL